MNFVGYTPAKHQRVVHTAIANHPTASVFVVVAPRQSGKTMLLMNELLRCSLNNKNAVSLCISGSGHVHCSHFIAKVVLLGEE